MKRYLFILRYWLGCIFYRYEVAVCDDLECLSKQQFNDWLDRYPAADGWGILAQVRGHVSLYRTVPRWPWPDEIGGDA